MGRPREDRGFIMFAGNSGSNRDWGGETADAGKLVRVGLISGGADIDILDFFAEDFRPELSRLTFGARTGEDDSLPDWKMLLSSHAESIVPGPN